MNAPFELLLQADPAGGDNLVVARTPGFGRAGNTYLGTMDRAVLLRTAGLFLQGALDPPVLDALLSAAGVGLDGADEDSTGFAGDVLDAANDALTLLRGQPEEVPR